jgi:hypothetical protein
MSALAIFGIVAALVAPLLVVSVFRRATRTVYDGVATLINVGILGNTAREKDYDYVNVEVPGHGALLLRVEKRRLTCHGCTTEVGITVRQSPFGKPYIATVQWPDQSRPESVDENFGGKVILPLWYFFVGMGALVLAADASTALGQHLALYASALILALAGFSFSWQSDTKLDAEAKSSVLGIPVGRGMSGLVVMTAICFAVNAAIFWTPSIFLLLGLNTAFAMGACAALIWKTRQLRFGSK